MERTYEITEEELDQATGAGSGMITTFTKICPTSNFGCC